MSVSLREVSAQALDRRGLPHPHRMRPPEARESSRRGISAGYRTVDHGTPAQSNSAALPLHDLTDLTKPAIVKDPANHGDLRVHECRAKPAATPAPAAERALDDVRSARYKEHALPACRKSDPDFDMTRFDIPAVIDETAPALRAARPVVLLFRFSKRLASLVSLAFFDLASEAA